MKALDAEIILPLNFNETLNGFFILGEKRSGDFFTTKEVGQGTGLGLYICHEIVRRHNGPLTFENSDRQGAIFVLRLAVK
jgi:phosphoglycerate-specific signal transduction histidine kinase